MSRLVGKESQATNSRADFRHKIGIALKEARESNYWLRIMERTKIGNQQQVKRLGKESGEIKAILACLSADRLRSSIKFLIRNPEK
ncbi:MAG: four helix bundle protein [Candidatus Marinimicrobia bacterium]|nr:four helix bundle protein [Candidatus Neomarinimicrobiota bacterium]MCH8070062.1 four helix bundle protein [Candidatus Neomarinimicrobiota bacterium]